MRAFAANATNDILEKSMTNMQLYLAAGLPTIAALVGILMNAVLYNSLNSRMTSMEVKFDLIMGKFAELDNRLTRLEERLERR
jgi:Na+/H+ antiporter NhaA